ncbi:hypothetical protein FYJ27_10950 [Anaerosalibacter bizertensis]|uniref:Uncharacterized protein n=1 Tax=Anaerosalibacter bizertensis TaxID=932217 RepID=A0A844FJW6_9FIRM|nr:hypothetical protein [Anaerosalibacter bizertensis]MBV1817276.1 hypothetical protein [Bacteroidales bacterium MSK.15.36]HHV25594.1 hypothetical protein [Tissierellia bacterium]MBU5294715.1 hypothetical protein [Anaerosalibacter bizertensis]MCB5559966.1 hypothetical protein [Anaerosalibacter bizertensis]MCG4565335.1 hypothetical protein [Anaerosalibacter bizertensis]
MENVIIDFNEKVTKKKLKELIVQEGREDLLPHLEDLKVDEIDKNTITAIKTLFNNKDLISCELKEFVRNEYYKYENMIILICIIEYIQRIIISLEENIDGKTIDTLEYLNEIKIKILNAELKKKIVELI